MANPLVYVGTDKTAVVEARKAIMDILTCHADEKSKRVALTTLKDLCAVNNTSFANCHISGKVD